MSRLLSRASRGRARASRRLRPSRYKRSWQFALLSQLAPLLTKLQAQQQDK